MTIHSLGYRTDLIFPRFDGEIIDRGDYLVVRTPSNPTFFWGNFLLFDSPPDEGDFERWRRLFSQEIGVSPQVRHVALGWDGTDGKVGVVTPFLEAEFELETSVVLSAREVVRPAKFCEEVVVRALHDDFEWHAALENQVASRDPNFSEMGWRIFASRQMNRYRAMTRAGLGLWFGAFLEGRLMADLGIFTDGEAARFQAVSTHPDFRRRGICGALVYEAARSAQHNLKAQTLVMRADANYHAARIYEGVGFERVEAQMGVSWWQKPDN